MGGWEGGREERGREGRKMRGGEGEGQDGEHAGRRGKGTYDRWRKGGDVGD